MTLFLMALIFIQGPGALQPGTGIVTGTVQIADGGSVAGVRVAAMAVEDPAGTNLLSVTETDAGGRYRLSNIPAGRYYIVAGRLDNLTYFPGGTDRTKATEVLVEPAKITSIANFTVPAESRRPPPPSMPPSFQESSAYGQIASERNAAKKLKLLLDFEKNNPKSSRLPEVYMQLSRAYASQSDLPKAMQYADKAVAAAARMKKDSPPALYPATTWQAWVASLDESAKGNLAWVKQMIAWQQNEIHSAILRRR